MTSPRRWASPGCSTATSSGRPFILAASAAVPIIFYFLVASGYLADNGS